MAQIERKISEPNTIGRTSNAKLIPTRREFKRPETIFENFADKKSIEAQVYRKRQRGDPYSQTIPEFDRENVAETTPERADRSEMQARARAINQIQNKLQKKGVVRTRRIPAFTRFVGLAVVCTAYVWQFFFALFSLIAFAAQAGLAAFKNDTLVGKFIGFFVDFEKYFPGEDIGLLFYGLASIVVIAVFSVYLVWFYLTGIRPFSTIMSFFVTVLCISLSLIPVTNLFPWTILWIAYCFSSSLFIRTR